MLTAYRAATVIAPCTLFEVIEGNHADNRILEYSVETDANYLVTGDRRHLLPLEKSGSVRILDASRSY